MKRTQRTALRLQAHNILTLVYMDHGFVRSEASRKAYEQIKGATDNLLKKVLAGDTAPTGAKILAEVEERARALAAAPASAFDDAARAYMQANKKFEDECWQAAKAELDQTANSGIDFAMRLRARAQEIKMERKQASR